MSILDDAIREHLELKRQHGADDAELKKLEDEAFGPPARPEGSQDSFAEAPTEFLAVPDAGDSGQPADGTAENELGEEDKAGRRINVADLQEAPPVPAEEQDAPEELEPDGPTEEEHPAMEHETVPDPATEIETGPSTEERHAISEQPTEIFDVEGDFEAPADAPGPSDEELVDAELAEPRLAPVDPIGGIEASAAAEPETPTDEEIEEHADEFDEFFSEQRLSDELNQALEAPLEEEHRNFAEEEEEAGDFAEAEADDEPLPAAADDQEEEHEDVLEDTPDFLADDPEDDNLWFEQKPPKDFDFDD